MSLTYTTLLAEVSSLTNLALADTFFVTQMPTAIDAGELRCYTDLDCINLDVTDDTGTTAALDRSFTLPTGIGTFQIVSDINIITPAQTSPSSGLRNRLTPVSRAVIDTIYGSNTTTGVPQFYCYNSQSTISGQKNILFGPWPDAAYRVEVVGKVQWTPISATNTTTFLSLYYPALLVASIMVFFAGAMKNFGSQADDPKSALSWEAYYASLLKGASNFEARKRFSGASWTSKQVEPTAVNQRG